MIKNIIYTCTSLHNLDIFEELLFNLIINILKKSYIKDSHSTIILKFIPNTHRIFHIQYSTYIPILFISKLILEILSFVSCAICKRRSNNEGKRRRKTKKRGRNGRKRKGYTCDSSETRRIKRIHRGNVNMHHRLDRIPIRIIPLPFSTLADPLTPDFFLRPPFIRFLHFIVCNLHARRSHLLHLRFLLRPSRAPLLSSRRQTLSPPPSLRNNYPRDILPGILPFPSLYTSFTFLSVSLSDITRGYDPYVAMLPLISNITPIRERHLPDISIESICCLQMSRDWGTRVGV